MTPALRPLAFGELFDRAFTLSVRTIFSAGWPLLLSVVVGNAGAFACFHLAPGLHGAGPALVVSGLLFLVACVSLGVTAAMTGQLDAYFGRKVNAARMLAGVRQGMPRVAILGLVFFALLTTVAAAFAALYQGGSWLMQQNALFDNDPWAKALPAYRTLLTFLGVAVFGFLACVGSVAFVAGVAEWSSGLESWRRGWELAGSGRRAVKTLIFGTILFVAGFTLIAVLQTALTFIVEQAHSDPAQFRGAIGYAGTALFLLYLFFECACYVVYYVDLRVRTEGLDLTLQSEALGTAAAAAR